MKIQEVLLRAMARKITWFQAAEILGFTDRHLRGKPDISCATNRESAEVFDCKKYFTTDLLGVD